MDGLFFAVRVTKSELAVEAQVIPQRSIFSLSLSLFHRYDRSHSVDTLEISGNCYAIDRVSKHRGPVMSHAIFSVVDR